MLRSLAVSDPDEQVRALAGSAAKIGKQKQYPSFSNSLRRKASGQAREM